MLSSEHYDNKQASKAKDTEINLECSQKIMKFIKESNEKEKDLYKKNKSNLLSTGIINISQPLDYS